jgi:hypothetical protein
MKPDSDSSKVPKPYVGIDINLNVGDIRHPTSTSVIPISEEFQYQHLSPFRYPKNITQIHWIWTQDPCLHRRALYFSATMLIYEWMWNIGYRIKVYSDIRYDVGLRSFQSDIGSSDIRLSPISLITNIGVSDHLCAKLGLFCTWLSGLTPIVSFTSWSQILNGNESQTLTVYLGIIKTYFLYSLAS